MKDALDGTVTGHPDQLILEGNNLLQAARTLAGL
jgi:pantothenate kinase